MDIHWNCSFLILKPKPLWILNPYTDEIISRILKFYIGRAIVGGGDDVAESR